MSPASILADLRQDGIELETDGVRIRWRPASGVSEIRKRLILEHKPEIIRLLTTPGLITAQRCQNCRRYLNAERQCWKCCDRRCHCGRQTGSAFIELCQLCATSEGQEESSSSLSGAASTAVCAKNSAVELSCANNLGTETAIGLLTPTLPTQ